MPDVTTITPNTPVWIDVSSPNLEASKQFYGQIFGWEAVQIAGPEAGNYTLFKIGGKDVAALASAMSGQPPAWTTYFATEHIDQSVEQFKAAGGEIVMGPMDVMGQVHLAILRDPTGAFLALMQPGSHRGFQLKDEPGAFTWAELDTRDLPRAKQFYQAAFGWGEETTPMGEGMPDYTQWQLNGQSIGGAMTMAPMVPAEVPAFWLVYFQVESADTTVAQIRQLGGQVMVEPVDSPAGRFAVVSDPQGAAFGILQPPAA